MRGVVGFRRLSLVRLFIPQGPTATTITFVTLTHELPLKAISCVIVALCAKLTVSSCLDGGEGLVAILAVRWCVRLNECWLRELESSRWYTWFRDLWRACCKPIEHVILRLGVNLRSGSAECGCLCLPGVPKRLVCRSRRIAFPEYLVSCSLSSRFGWFLQD